MDGNANDRRCQDPEPAEDGGSLRREGEGSVVHAAASDEADISLENMMKIWDQATLMRHEKSKVRS